MKRYVGTIWTGGTVMDVKVEEGDQGGRTRCKIGQVIGVSV